MKRTFFCDNCGHPLTNIENGWVEWIRSKDETDVHHHGLRIVHKLSKDFHGVHDKGCKYNNANIDKKSSVQDMPLTSFLGENGPQSLIHLFSTKNFPKDEFVRFMKRILIPGYDELILCLPKAKDIGIVENNDWDLYSTEKINIIIDKINSLEK